MAFNESPTRGRILFAAILSILFVGSLTLFLIVNAPEGDGARPSSATLSTQVTEFLGELYIQSIPANATLRINGEIQGKTPIIIKRIPYATLEISLSKPGYQEFTDTITFNQAMAQHLSITLTPWSISLNVTSEPSGASVLIDGEHRGKTPLILKGLPQTVLDLTIQRGCYRAIQKQLQLSTAEKQYLDFTLEYNCGNLELTSFPPGAAIYSGENNLGNTPRTLTGVLAGKRDFVLRKKGYPGEDGRLRTPIAINNDKARYESAAEEYHTDFALRYSHYIGELEFGLSYFKGTSREPDIRATDFVSSPTSTAQPLPTTLYPYYYQMDQVGLELQYLLGGWIVKGELINRQSEVVDFTAWTTGFEYTFTGIFRTESDVSILSEWLHDDRQDTISTPFEDDIMIGARLSFNDIDSTEITLALIQDLDSSPSLLSIEASRRLTDHWKLNVDAYWWLGSKSDDPFYLFRDDDFVSLSLNYYF